MKKLDKIQEAYNARCTRRKKLAKRKKKYALTLTRSPSGVSDVHRVYELPINRPRKKARV